MKLLDSLKQYTTVVADTGDIEAIAEYQAAGRDHQSVAPLPGGAEAGVPSTWSTRRSEHASQLGGDQAARQRSSWTSSSSLFGREILKIVPGRVSTEVDAELELRYRGTIAKARKLIALREGGGRPRADPDQDRQHLGRHPRGRAARARRDPLQPDAALQLRPGRRLRRGGRDADLALRRPHLRLVQEGRRRRRHPGRQDPGVASVTRIYNYYKKFGYKTQVMGASFRKVDRSSAWPAATC